MAPSAWSKGTVLTYEQLQSPNTLSITDMLLPLPTVHLHPADAGHRRHIHTHQLCGFHQLSLLRGHSCWTDSSSLEEARHPPPHQGGKTSWWRSPIPHPIKVGKPPGEGPPSAPLLVLAAAQICQSPCSQLLIIDHLYDGNRPFGKQSHVWMGQPFLSFLCWG